MDAGSPTPATKNDRSFRSSGMQSRASDSPFEGTLMQRFQHLMVCLTCSESDFGLIRYTAMLARLDVAIEVRFVHVLPAPQAGSPARDHGRALQELERSVGEAFLNIPDNVKLYCDVLKGPLSVFFQQFLNPGRGDLFQMLVDGFQVWVFIQQTRGPNFADAGYSRDIVRRVPQQGLEIGLLGRGQSRKPGRQFRLVVDLSFLGTRGQVNPNAGRH